MSSSGSNSNVPKICLSCYCDIDLEKECTLSCLSGHTLCGACGQVYAGSVMACGHSAVPPKCSFCQCEVPSAAFERMLDSEQLSMYLNFVTASTLLPGEKIYNCIDCDYREIRTDDPPIFWCKGVCEKVHCTVCMTTLTRPSDESDDYEDDDLVDGVDPHSLEMVRHFQCSALKDEKEKFDRAIVEANGMPCPTCGVIGRKDGMCTHMTCEKCNTVWCYLCALSVDVCDKASGEGEPIFGHNKDWKTNEKRCPMYLSLICQIDGKWQDVVEEVTDSNGNYDEEDLEESCLNKLHKWRAMQKLHAVYLEIGDKKWNELWTTFESVQNCGHDKHDIENADDAPLFVRPSEDSTHHDE